jgi:allantoinase
LDLLFRAPRVITAAGEVARYIGVRDGRIVVIEPIDTELDADEVVELGDDEVLIAGLVDTHVHVNEPGRTEWEGFASATRAAAAGGVTTIVDMPLNSIPPTVDVEALAVKRRVAADQAYVDVGFWGGAVPGNVADLRALHDAGVFGFKCFLLHSGVNEFPPLDPEGLELALKEIASFGAMMIVHAEDAHAIDRAASPRGDNYTDFLSSRPRGAENLAIAEVIELARWTGCRVHVLHLSSSDALPMIASARRDGVKLTVETCPHYLSFVSEEIPAGATQFKCCPPIREAGNRELLWQGLADGVIDCVVTDHSPCTVDLKRFDIGDFGVAWGGIASLQISLSAVWTEAKRRDERRGPVDGGEPGPAGRIEHQGPHRPRVCRRLRGLCTGRGLHRRCGKAPTQESRLRLRPAPARRSRAQHLAGRQADRSGRGSERTPAQPGNGVTNNADVAVC